MVEYGGNELATEPRRLLPEGSVLVYRRVEGTELWGQEFVQLAAVDETRWCRWSFMIKEVHPGHFELDIDNQRGWKAFTEVPDIFVQLAGMNSEEACDSCLTIDGLVSIFENAGAVEQTR